MIVGRVDKMAGTSVFGWAMDDEDPAEHVTIEIISNGVVLAHGLANRFRADLKSGGFGQGDHAFELDLNSSVAASSLTVRASSSAHNGVLEFADPDEHKFSELYDILVARYDTLFAAMVQRSQKFEQSFTGTLDQKIDERHSQVERQLQDFNSRLETAELSLLRIDQMVRRLVDEQQKRKRKRFFGLI